MELPLQLCVLIILLFSIIGCTENATCNRRTDNEVRNLHFVVIMLINCFRRTEMIDISLKEAVNVPLNLMRQIDTCWQYIAVLAEHGNIQTISDLQVCILCSRPICT